MQQKWFAPTAHVSEINALATVTVTFRTKTQINQNDRHQLHLNAVINLISINNYNRGSKNFYFGYFIFWLIIFD